jgi:hypothetical protein
MGIRYRIDHASAIVRVAFFGHVEHDFAAVVLESLRNDSVNHGGYSLLIDAREVRELDIVTQRGLPIPLVANASSNRARAGKIAIVVCPEDGPVANALCRAAPFRIRIFTTVNHAEAWLSEKELVAYTL